MTLGGDFSKDVPTKSSTQFAEDKPAQGGSFTKDAPPKSNVIMDGDNTSGGVYSGEFETFGDIYGQGVFGGQVHFKARPTLPVINH